MENLIDDDKRRDEILANALEELKIHFDTVQIITTKADKDKKVQYQSESFGNFYERWGALKAAETQIMAKELDNDNS